MSGHIEKARELKNEFKIEEAAKEFAKAYDADAKSAEAASNAGLCNLMLGKIDEADSFFAKALKITPEDDIVRIYSEITQCIKGKSYKSPELKDKNISVAEQFMATAEMLFAAGKKDYVFKLFEVVISSVKELSWLNLASNQYRIACLLAKFGLFSDAQQIAETLTNESAKTWHGYAASAQVKLEQGDIPEAKLLFNKALECGGDKDPLVVSAVSDTRLLQMQKKK